MALYIAEKERLAIKKFKNKKTTREQKDKLYKDIIYPAFKKLAESLMLKHNQKINDPYNDTKNDLISHLTELIDKYDPKRPAFNYFNLCARNYILQECVVKKDKKISIIQVYRKDVNKTNVGADENTLNSKSNSVDDRFIDTSYENYGEESINEFFIFLKKKLKKILSITESQNERLFLDNVLMIMDNKDTLDINNKKELYIILRNVTSFKSRDITKYTTKLKQYYKSIYDEYYNSKKM